MSDLTTSHIEEKVIIRMTSEECRQRLESSPLYIRRERDYRVTHQAAINEADLFLTESNWWGR